MMNSTPIIKSFPPPPIDRREIYRYMKCKSVSADTEALVNKAILLCDGELRYDTVSLELPVMTENDGITDFGTVRVSSRDLSKDLCGCDRAVIFAATVGLGIDRLIAKYGKTSPSLALAIQAYGAERIESLCDAFCAEAKQKYGNIRPRFSAGYGDLPLEFQNCIFSILNCNKSIGLTLNGSLLMSPSKSVTAIIGIGKTDNNYETT